MASLAIASMVNKVRLQDSLPSVLIKLVKTPSISLGLKRDDQVWTFANKKPFGSFSNWADG